MLQDTERTRSMWACTCPEDDATRSVAASIITAARALLVQRQELRAALPAVQVAEIASVTSNRKWNVQVGVATVLPRPQRYVCVACVQREKCQAGQRELEPQVCVTANQCTASQCWQITGWQIPGPNYTHWRNQKSALPLYPTGIGQRANRGIATQRMMWIISSCLFRKGKLDVTKSR